MKFCATAATCLLCNLKLMGVRMLHVFAAANAGRAARSALASSVVIVVAACGGGGSDSSPADLCAAAKFNVGSSAFFSGGPSISFVLACSQITADQTGITRDQFGRITSYAYRYQCANGGESHTGSVTDITYNGLGQALSWSYSVNGQACGSYRCVYDASNQLTGCSRS